MEVSLTTAGLVLVPIILAVVSLVKMYLDSRWSPLVAVVVGLVGSYVCVKAGWMPDMNIWATGLTGLLAALTSAGLYSGVKTTVGA
jgi:hypothetical protein